MVRAPNSIDIGAIPAIDQRVTPKPAGSTFADHLAQSIGEVDRLQAAADVEVNKTAHGAGNLHETSLALEKADISLRLLTRVRNKVVEAYQDIMRMNV